MARHWRWETESSEWGVDLDEGAGVLRWWGADKPRPGVPAYAQGGGGMDQPVADLVSTGEAPYACPPAVLAEVRSAASAWRPPRDAADVVAPDVAGEAKVPVKPSGPASPTAPPGASVPQSASVPPSATGVPSASAPTRPTLVKLPPFTPHSIDAVLCFCQAALQRLTGSTGSVPETRRQVSVREVPDDRPTQSSGWIYTTEVELGDRARFECIEEAGGFFQGSATWTTPDFAGTGRLRLSFDSFGVELEGAPAVVEVFSAMLGASRAAGA